MKFNTQTLQGLKRRQMLMYILLFSLITIVIWAAFSLFLSQKKEPIPPELLRLSQPLNPNIDTQVIENLEQKRAYRSSELDNFPIFTIVKDNESQASSLITIEKAQQQEAEKRASQERLYLESLATPAPQATPIATQSGTITQ